MKNIFDSLFSYFQEEFIQKSIHTGVANLSGVSCLRKGYLQNTEGIPLLFNGQKNGQNKLSGRLRLRFF